MTVALGQIGWTPEVFWKATPYETSCAYIGWCRTNGAGYFGRGPGGWSQADLDSFKAEIEEAKKRFPDE